MDISNCSRLTKHHLCGSNNEPGAMTTSDNEQGIENYSNYSQKNCFPNIYGRHFWRMKIKRFLSVYSG